MLNDTKHVWPDPTRRHSTINNLESSHVT